MMYHPSNRSVSDMLSDTVNYMMRLVVVVVETGGRVSRGYYYRASSRTWHSHYNDTIP